MDDVHIYDDVGHQGRYRSSNKTEAVTSFNDQQKYMTLYGQQGGQSEYQEPQLCSMDTGKAVDTRNDEMKGSSDFYGQKDELKNIKRCLCAEFSCSDPFSDNSIISRLGSIWIYPKFTNSRSFFRRDCRHH